MIRKLLLVLCAVSLGTAYDPMFDEFNAEAAVVDMAILEGLMECLTNIGPCNEVAAAYKELMPEVVMTTCEKCSPRQKEILRIVIGSGKKQFPELYAKFKNLYDPNNQKGADLDAFVAL